MAAPVDEQVALFLAALDNDRREGFLNYAEHTYSIYEIWLYATVLGYRGGFTELEQWVSKNYRKLNRRALLLGEITKLEGDIEDLREHVRAQMVKPDVAASKIAHLSKELRGHVTEIEKMTRATDRRGLILAGADAVMRSLRVIFKDNDEVLPVLEMAFESVWAQLEAGQ
jgi:signal recognition particle GTPase